MSKEFAAAYQLNITEVAAFQRALDSAYAKLEELALEHTLMSRPDTDTVMLEVVPFDGAAISDDLFDAIRAVLDSARYQSFVNTYADEVEVAFYSFGAERREIKINRSPNGDLTVTQSRTSVDSIIDGSPVIFATRADLEPSIGRLTSLLPPDF